MMDGECLERSYPGLGGEQGGRYCRDLVGGSDVDDSTIATHVGIREHM